MAWSLDTRVVDPLLVTGVTGIPMVVCTQVADGHTVFVGPPGVLGFVWLSCRNWVAWGTMHIENTGCSVCCYATGYILD